MPSDEQSLSPRNCQHGPLSPAGESGKEMGCAGPAVVGPPFLMADGSSSGAGSRRVAVALTFRSAGREAAKNAELRVGATLAWPRRQELGTGHRE